MNDSEIILLFLNRDENAIKQTKLKYGDKLSGLSFKILHNSEDSEECVSDTYLKVWNTIPPQMPDFFFAYIAKICRFICFGKLDYEKAKKRNAQALALSDELIECVPSRLADSILSEQVIRDTLNKFVKSLSGEKRLIFMRRYWFSDSISEISQRYHVSESKVKTTLFRTREQLKIDLMKEGINV